MLVTKYVIREIGFNDYSTPMESFEDGGKFAFRNIFEDSYESRGDALKAITNYFETLSCNKDGVMEDLLVEPNLVILEKFGWDNMNG